MKQVYNFSRPDNPPPGAWYESVDGVTTFGCNRYDGDFLTFQIIFFALPCLASSYFVFTAGNHLFIAIFIYLVIASLISFWILSNFRNKIIFHISDGMISARKGYPLRKIFSVKQEMVEAVYIKRKTGYTGRRSWNSGTGEVQDLVLRKKNGEEINLGSFFQNIHKHYFAFVIVHEIGRQ